MTEPRTVPIEEWGKDHWSTFAYVETRCVDYRGNLDKDHMRTNPQRHPAMVGPRVAMLEKASPSSTFEYPTRIKSGTEPEHDDWDCFYDIERAGLVEDKGTGLFPVAVLTTRGKEIAAKLRAHKANGGSFASFVL